jgi:hypothetical protein
MSTSSTDAIRATICLTRGLCESPGLLEYRLASRHALHTLTQSSYMRNSMELKGLFLWTFCSRQKFSTAIQMENCGHILIDGFQMDALFYLFQALSLAPDNRPLAVMLPQMLAEDYLNANDVGMADALINLSIAAARRFPDAISGLSGRDLRFQLEIQRIFVIGHEIGHILLEHSTPSQQAERTPVMQARLDHAIRFVSSRLAPDREPLAEVWTLRGSDERFRDELFCDTVALEMVEAALALFGEKPSEWQRLTFETIYFTAYALDLMRTLKKVASVSESSFDAVTTEALLGRDFIRSVSLNLLAQSRFGATRAIVDGLLERVERARDSEYGLLHVLRVAEHHRQRISSDAQFDDHEKARLYSICQWRPDPKALFQDQIY